MFEWMICFTSFDDYSPVTMTLCNGNFVIGRGRSRRSTSCPTTVNIRLILGQRQYDLLYLPLILAWAFVPHDVDFFFFFFLERKFIVIGSISLFFITKLALAASQVDL